MKAARLLALLALSLVACADAVVISADGSTELDVCDYDNASCVAFLCPGGAYQLRVSANFGNKAHVFRCLPVDGGR